MSNKRKIRILSLLTLIVLLLTAASSAFSEVVVDFKSEEDSFVFYPGSDLFENFKNLYPGDSIAQEITVKNSSNTELHIYLRAMPANEEDEKFLSQISMNIKSDNLDEDVTGANPGKLSENKLIGRLGAKLGYKKITVTITVPSEMGNEFQNVAATIPWIFTAEKAGNDPGDNEGNEVLTGDTYSPWLLAAAVAALILAIAALIIVYRKKSKAAK